MNMFRRCVAFIPRVQTSAHDTFALTPPLLRQARQSIFNSSRKPSHAKSRGPQPYLKLAHPFNTHDAITNR
jgi:hypothetical protein